MTEWTCFGPGARHAAQPRWSESCGRHGSSEIEIHRCARCGQLYHYRTWEVSDWSGSGDYGDVTRIWTAIDADAADHIRSDVTFIPSGQSHRDESGWRRDG